MKKLIALATMSALASGPAFAACDDMKLYDVSDGSFVIDSSFAYAFFAAGEPVQLVVPQQVIVHPRGVVLFDTGIADDVAEGRCHEHWGEGLCDGMGATWSRDMVIDRKLAKIGHSIEDVKYVVYSHFHLDHVGNIELFPDAVHVVQRDEIREAWWPERFYSGAFVMNDFDDARDFTYLELEGDYDLFGDGCIQIISTPGHTPGHQSLMVRLPKTGPVILTGDAAVNPDHLEGAPLGYVYDIQGSLRSVERLKQLRDRDGADIWLTHNMEQYKGRRHDQAYE